MPRRMRLIAVGAAIFAMVFTLVAVIVVLTRGGDAPAKAAVKPPEVAPLTDHTVLAANVVRLKRNDIEVVVEAGVTKGVRVKDDLLAKDLGLEPDDIIIALSGMAMTRDSSADDIIMRLSHVSATTLYAEVLRKGQPTLLRWRLDGDLRQARYGSSSTLGSLGTYTPSVPLAPDPLLDTIERIDDMNIKVPRATAEKLLVDPTAYSRHARVIPAMKNGQVEGLKLYAIRPSSLYARLGFSNGDTVHSVNGLSLDGIDKALEAFTKLKSADELTFDITRRGKPLALRIQITK